MMSIADEEKGMGLIWVRLNNTENTNNQQQTQQIARDKTANSLAKIALFRSHKTDPCRKKTFLQYKTYSCAEIKIILFSA